jgi:hypothetical protein
MDTFTYKKFRTRIRRAPAIAASLLLCGVVAIAILLLPWGSPAPKATAESHFATAAPIGPPPDYAVAGRRGVAELIGQGGRSPIAWNAFTALWGGHTKPNWWQSGLALLTVVRFAEATRDRNPNIQRVILRVYVRNHIHTWGTARFDFANEFGDDTAWWGQAWLEAARYELYVRHDMADAARFLSVAEWDANYISRMPKTCGGIPWALRRPADTVTSAEFVTLSAGLASFREARGPFYDPGLAATWIADARAALDWLVHTRLVNIQAGTVLDGLNAHCKLTGGSMTYSEGEMADALVGLGTALHQPAYYRQAKNFLRYTLSSASGLNAGGILRERCEGKPTACGRLRYYLDIPAFKGIFVLAVSDWRAATHSHEFRRFLRAQARAVVTQALLDPPGAARACSSARTCQFGFHWVPVIDASPKTLAPTVGSQESAIDALTAVLAAS